MRACIVPAARGASWLAQGARLFVAAPLAWLFLVAAYYFLIMAASLVPVLGFVAVGLTTPAFSVGFMNVARAAAAGTRPELAHLFDAFRRDMRTQLILGAAYLAFVAVIFAGVALADDGTLRNILAARKTREQVGDVSGLLFTLGVAGAVYAAGMTIFWFAPVLASWHGQPASKALFFSIVACFMNWRAFLVYGAIAAAVVIAIPYLIVTVLVLVSGGAVRGGNPSVLLPFVLLFLPPLYASFYASYRDVFAVGEEGG